MKKYIGWILLFVLIASGSIYYLSKKQTVPGQSSSTDKSLALANEQIKQIVWDKVLRHMEYYYDFHTVIVGYGPGIATGDCSTAGSAFSSKDVQNDIQELKTLFSSRGSEAKLSCWNTAGKWAMSVSLLVPEKQNTYWCIDNNTKSVFSSQGIGLDKEISSTSCI
ncbi:MAG: hypothetical protein JWL80_108 [Parcubacteria group bacterium]|nr:hypothetical protein [Parcubacteria group bacterium]